MTLESFKLHYNLIILEIHGFSGNRIAKLINCFPFTHDCIKTTHIYIKIKYLEMGGRKKIYVQSDS